MLQGRTSPAPKQSTSALIGSKDGDARAGAMTNDTFVLDVVRPITELRPVLKLRKLKALTPYNPDAWEHILARAHLLREHQHIPDHLWYGFCIKLPLITSTQTPPNHPTVKEFQPQFTEIVLEEIHKGHYIGPFSHEDLEMLIGPFQ